MRQDLILHVKTDLFIVDVPGEVCCWPGPRHAAVEAEVVPDVVPSLAAGDERTSRPGSLNHQQVGVLCVGGEDRRGPTDLAPEPPRGFSADGDQRDPGLGGARQVHGEPGHGVNGLGLRLVQNKTKQNSSELGS